ncbi:MAG: hypothetical protein ABL308_11475 [Oceanicaulis sp.]
MKQLVMIAAAGLGLGCAADAHADRYYDCEATIVTQADGPVQGQLWLSDRGRGDAVQFRRVAGRYEFTETSGASWRDDRVSFTIDGEAVSGHAETIGGAVRFTGVYGDRYDGVWWADCNAGASAPAWSRDMETVAGAELELRALQGLDLDTGGIVAVGASQDIDIFLGMYEGRIPLIVAGPRARIKLSESAPSFEELEPRRLGCDGVAAERVGQGLPFSSIERGSAICVMTDEGYVGAVRVIEANAGGAPFLRFSFERWDVLR